MTYLAVIRVTVGDPPEKRARDIADGLGDACGRLLDEYGWTADAIADVLERIADEVRDEWESRRPEGPAAA